MALSRHQPIRNDARYASGCFIQGDDRRETVPGYVFSVARVPGLSPWGRYDLDIHFFVGDVKTEVIM